MAVAVEEAVPVAEEVDLVLLVVELQEAVVAAVRAVVDVAVHLAVVVAVHEAELEEQEVDLKEEKQS